LRALAFLVTRGNFSLEAYPCTTWQPLVEEDLFLGLKVRVE